MKRIFALWLITLGVLLSLGGLGRLYLNNRVTSPETFQLPSQIAGLPITDSKTGADAVSEFTDLHGKEFPVTSGAIGSYGNRQITLWVASTANVSTALELTTAMQARIAEGNSPFKPINEFNNKNRKVYVLEGMGLKHYYFQSENLIIWLAADPVKADAAIKQILEDYP